MMFKLLALTSVLTSAVLAQTTSSSNPLIPSDISQSCSTFLNTLNADPTFASCLSTLTSDTSKFAPNASTPSSTDVTSTLSNLCTSSVTSACPDSLIRTQITNLVGACTVELTTNPVQIVRNLYEVLYTILPLQQSICSKDDSGNYCVYGPSKITRRDEAIVPNVAAISQSNAMFLFFTPSLNATQLCITCLRQLMTAYINFESNTPFAYPLNSSTLLSGQLPLYNAVQSKCPSNFLSGAVAAGGLSGSSSSAIPTHSTEYQRIIALVMGAVTLVIYIAL